MFFSHSFQKGFYALMTLSIISFALNIPLVSAIATPRWNALFNNDHNVESSARVLAATDADISKARDIVASSMASMVRSNRVHLDLQADADAPREAFVPGPEVRQAASLVAEFDAAVDAAAQGYRQELNRQTSFWMEDIEHRDTIIPGNPSDQSYRAFRNVMEYGAKGNGIDDDSAAIEFAMADGGRCVNEYCYGSTTKNAIVYFPPGTYLVTRPIVVGHGTAMIGDAHNYPTIKAGSSFLGLGVVSTNGVADTPFGRNNRMWMPNANFYRQIRNFRIDIREAPQDSYVCAVHHQVGQGTSLQFIDIFATEGTETTQQGIFIENGSGGHISDIRVYGGRYGMYVGSQQFTSQRLTFENCVTAIQVHWDWTWTFKTLEIRNCTNGLLLHNWEHKGIIGSVTILDSKFISVPLAITVNSPFPETEPHPTSLVLDNVVFEDVLVAVQGYNNANDHLQTGDIRYLGSIFLPGDVGSVDMWVMGSMYYDPMTKVGAIGGEPVSPRNETLTVAGSAYVAPDDESESHGFPKNVYFERPRPQYHGHSVEDFVHLKDYCVGDGVADDTEAFRRAVNENYGKKIILVDAGVYMISDTITLPSGTRLVGEAWSQIMAYGPQFSDAGKPTPLIRVGREYEVGWVELTDLMFTTKGGTAGLVAVEWNILADEQGTAGMWDCHVRIGGAIGTDLTPKECPPYRDGTIRDNCVAASLMMHITPSASGYFENIWLFVADHLLDDLDVANPLSYQVSVFAARGLLVQSSNPVWLYATSVEHATLYQYNLHHTRNVFAAIIQTESPYYQPLPRLPGAFQAQLAAETFEGDYDLEGCREAGGEAGLPGVGGQPGGDSSDSKQDGTERVGCGTNVEAWALIVRGSQDVHIAGAALYSWFKGYEQECIAPDILEPACQDWLIFSQHNIADVHFHNIVTVGSTGMMTADDKEIWAQENRMTHEHPYWSIIAIFEASG